MRSLVVLISRLQKQGFRIKTVWSSPFRRCLQTAAAAAREYGVHTVHVHTGLGESSHAVAKCLASASIDSKFAIVGDPPMYLSTLEKSATVGSGFAIREISSAHYYDRAFAGGFFERFSSVLREILKDPHVLGSVEASPSAGVCADESIAGDILVVTHGDAVAVTGGMLERPVVIYDVEYCATVACDVSLRELIYTHGVCMLREDGD